MIDYHIHPDYSIDAEPFSMVDYCRKAVEIGLKEICFTTHCEFDESRSKLDWFVRSRGEIVSMHPVTWLDNYFYEVRQCQKSFCDTGLTVRIGLEAGYDLGLDRKIAAVLEQYPFDFVIGSIHCLEHIAISSGKESPAYFPGKEPGEVAKDYFCTLKEAIQSKLFDVVGHLDIYRRHGTGYLGERIDEIHSGYLEEIFALLVKTDTGLELNTSSVRHDQGDFYPSYDIVKEAVLAGVDKFTVGSDCHRLGELGSGVGHAMKVAKKLGVKFSVYDQRIPRCFEDID